MREAIAKEFTSCGVKSGNVFALAATRAAYIGCDAWLDGLKSYLMDNRDPGDGLCKGKFPEGGRHAAGGDLPDMAGLPRAGT